MARLEAAGNLAEIARHSGLTPVQGQQMAQLALERVTEVMTAPDANGVYEAVVEIKTPDGNWQIKTVGDTEKPLKNTMFPEDWDAQRVQAEIDSAWASQRPHPEDKNKWIGTSSSGIEIEGYKQPRTTAYPLYGRGKKP